MHPVRRRLAVLLAALSVAAGACGGGSGGSSAPTAAAAPSSDPATATPSAGASGRCLVRLHGKGGDGADTTVQDGVTILSPAGNSEGWGKRQWLYFPDQDYSAARTVVSDAVAGCEQVIIDGFSNGGAFAAKLYCRGETFGGHLVRVVVDDPVVDNGLAGCAPDPSVGVTMYWTGALEAQAQPGWKCSEADWTCEGGTTIGVTAYATALGTEPLASPHHKHEPYVDAPELSQWR